jgi:sugar-specific transcriptional regulator TrmB
MEKELEKLGLSRNESTIYLFLLKKGVCTTGPIIKGTGISNSRVYQSLNSLVGQGLVSYTVQKNGKHFKAEDPKKFLVLEDERKKKIEKLIPNLAKIRSTAEEDVSSAVFEGFEGLKTAFNKLIDDCPEKGTIHILGFSKQDYASESLRTVLRNINLRSHKKKHKLMVILDKGVKKTYGKDREREPNTDVRYMPEGYMSPAAIDIIDGYVYIFIWEEKPFVFMIKNDSIAESFKHYFKFLWNIAEKY